MKITKRQLRKIIKEERARLVEQSHRGNPNKPWDAVFPAAAPGSVEAAISADIIYDKLEKAISEATAAIGEDAVLKFLSSFVENY
ncbi:hypothetical protein CMI47_08720 [Candidatus Pacearchaeota archaeon]|nr:hypothetical protein [Candidatus Pacearchaeota archaeon]|tara:strand:+ start:95 stop:349 length:255 start_codon:yes stop_codon:yes gene_type:complete